MQNASFNPRTYTQIHTATVVQGRGKGWGLMEPLPRVFDMFSIIRNDFAFKMRYILFLVTPLEACDITNNGRHLRFYQELEIR